MAKERLTLYDKYGNAIEYDISSASVTIDAEGKSLDIKLSEIVATIAATVKSITFNGNSPAPDASGNVNLGQQMQADWGENNPEWPSYIRNKPTIPDGSTVRVDTQMSSTSENVVQNKVIKAYVDAVSQRIDTLLGSGNVQGAIDTFNEVVAFLNGISSSDTLAAKLLLKANSADVYTKAEVDDKVANAGKVKSVSVNGGTPVQPVNGNVDLTVTGIKGDKGDKGDTLLVDGNFNPVTDIVNDMTTGGANKAWSAEMGKQLAADVDDIPVIDIHVDGRKLVINTNAALAPRVIVGALSKSALSCRGGQTDTATFKVSGRRLTAAITAALSDSTHFSISPASISPSSGVVEETTLTVTYTPGSGATAGTSHSLTVTIASGGVTYGTLQLTGTVAAAPSIVLTPASLPISAESGQQGTGTINVKGTALDGDISLAISGSGFSLSTNTVSKAEAESAGGKDITVTFDGSAAGNATITASSTGATNATASVTGSIIQRKAEGETIINGGLTYTVLADTTKVSVRATSPSTLIGDIVVPSSVEDDGVNYEVASIPKQGFQGAKCSSITLPVTLKDIGESAFLGASSLTSIDVGDGLESVGKSAFFGTKLVNVVLPDSLKTCGHAPFQSISTLKSIQLGKTTAFSPTSIDNILTWAGSSTDDANDNNLDTVICYATTPPTLSNYPRGIAGAVLKVPSGSVSAYQAANNWDKFGTIEAI